MKRLDLVQLTIIIVGIMSAFACLESLPSFLIYIFQWFTDGLSGGYYMQSFIYTILLLSTYSIFSIYAIKNSKQLAEYICGKGNLDAQVNLAIDKSHVLYALFLGLGIYGFIKNLPKLIRDIVVYIQRSNDSMSSYEPIVVSKSLLFTETFTTGMFFVLICYAWTFAQFLATKIKNTEPVDEINSHNES